MIRQKRKIQLEVRGSSEEAFDFTVGDLRTFLIRLDQHNISNDVSINTYRHLYKFGVAGFEAEWEEWTDGSAEEDQGSDQS